MKLGKIGSTNLVQWRNPYVTDGLISMWDGEWNAGRGIHDPAHGRWENLADHRCYATPVAWLNTHGPTFDDNCVVFAKNYCQIANPSYLSSAKYVDVLFMADQANNQYSSYLLEMAAANITFQAKGQAALKDGTGLGSTLKTWLGKGIVHLFSVDFSDLTASVPYLNGATVAYNRDGTFGGINKNMMGRGYWNDHYFYGRVFCIRVYNRALTADERLANYAVDKARFNLP